MKVCGLPLLTTEAGVEVCLVVDLLTVMTFAAAALYWTVLLPPVGPDVSDNGTWRAGLARMYGHLVWGGVSRYRRLEQYHRRNHREVCSSCGHRIPLRGRHSRDTGRCVMKWDHYCPYVGNDIGEFNHGT